MTVPIWPNNLVPDAVNWRLATQNKILSSPFNRCEQILGLKGPHWAAQLTFVLTESERRQVLVFLAKLRGYHGTFLFPVSLLYSKQGSGAGSVTVTSVYNLNRIYTTGWSATWSSMSPRSAPAGSPRCRAGWGP